ncbi:single-stranded DNA-binding protein [Solibacillus silvestris]
MNNICIMGRIANDLELRHTTNDHAVLQFTVAVRRPHTKDTTDFIRCVAWRNAAEFISKYFKKGKMISLSGVMSSRSWKDDDGKNHSLMEMIVDTVEFCGDKPNEAAATATESSSNIPEGFEEIKDEEIPF